MGISKLIYEFFKKKGRLPKLHLFIADNWELLFKKPPKDVKKILDKKSKRLQITNSFEELSKKEHQRAFTVSKVMNADVLQDVINYIKMAVEAGQSFEEFKRNAPQDLLNVMQNAGWTGKNASRLELIYKTNVQMAATRGKYQQFYITKSIYPNLEYRQIERNTKRHAHSILHGLIFSWDDPLLNTIAPPSAFRCGCSLVPTKKPPTDNSNLTLDKKEFYLSPLQEWIPDFNKYSAKLKKELINSLKRDDKSSNKILPD